MVQTDDDTDGRLPKMSMEKMFHLIMDELVGTRKELKEDIANLDAKLSKRIDVLDRRLSTGIESVDAKVTNLSMKVDRNFLTFMNNHDDLEQRVTVLEERAA